VTTNLLTIRAFNRDDRENADLYPVATDKLSFELEDDETIEWRGTADLMGLDRRATGPTKSLGV
jgi:hypothetical protein